MRAVTSAVVVLAAAALLAAAPVTAPAADGTAPVPAPAAEEPAPGGGLALLDDALSAIAMTRDDLSFRTDYADHPDSFRIAVVDSLLQNPLDTEHYVRGLAEELAVCRRLSELVGGCARELDVDSRASAAGGTDVGDPAAGETAAGASDGGRVEYSPVEVLLTGIREASVLIDRAFAGLTDEERAFIAEHAAVLLEEEEFDPEKPIDVRDREAEEDEELGDELLRVAGLVDYVSLASAGTVLAAAVDDAVPLLDLWDGPFEGRARRDAPGDPGSDGGPWSGDVALVLETDAGTVVLGGPGRTVYEGTCAVIIDRGGDDVYLAGVGGAVPGLPACVVIDMGGDDTYLAGDHALGAGFMGAGVLVDLEGDDAYRAGNFSQGSGLFGVGVLRDAGGNDRYTGDTCTQGSGAFGIGVLLDEDGNDEYTAAVFSQAFGFVKGLGTLLDSAGNDVYFAGGKYTDEIRYFDHYISLSQGFGFGWRPDASGGIGLLADAGGNDVYVSDIFGQGSSYWFSVGGLVDASGNDQYVSYQYAQGAGTHITVAALVDLEGDDNYVSKGVSQGCGHDLAIGILHDLAGDDNYTCHDLSQGAGNANGIGILLDDSGDDAYSVRGPLNTHGYGNYRRDYGSVGIFIDAAGSDSYSGPGADGTWWVGSDHGVGIDAGPEGGAQE
ncbi:MAG: hypothetical protein ABIG03_05985 [Candidatus Eisenbacteria bacterium]